MDPERDAGDRGVTLVLPAFDEERRLGPTLDRLIAGLDDVAMPWRIVVVDDGSADATADIARSAADRGVDLVRLGEHRGKGAALRAGTARADLPYVVFVDADLPVPLATLSGMLDMAAGADGAAPAGLVVGSRRLPGSDVIRPQPLVRRVGGRAFLAAAHLLGVRSTSDPQCGVKVLRRDQVGPLVAATRSDGFAFDIELIELARRAGVLVAEHPVVWNHVDGSSIRPLRDAVRTLSDLVDLRRR